MQDKYLGKFVSRGFAVNFDDHTISLYHEGEMLARFGAGASPQVIQMECLRHLKTNMEE